MMADLLLVFQRSRHNVFRQEPCFDCLLACGIVACPIRLEDVRGERAVAVLAEHSLHHWPTVVMLAVLNWTAERHVSVLASACHAMIPFLTAS